MRAAKKNQAPDPWAGALPAAERGWLVLARWHALAADPRPAIDDGMVVVPGEQLVALDTETGERLWAVPSSDVGRFIETVTR